MDKNGICTQNSVKLVRQVAFTGILATMLGILFSML